jgi:hypothetical protein
MPNGELTQQDPFLIGSAIETTGCFVLLYTDEILDFFKRFFLLVELILFLELYVLSKLLFLCIVL